MGSYKVREILLQANRHASVQRRINVCPNGGAAIERDTQVGRWMNRQFLLRISGFINNKIKFTVHIIFINFEGSELQLTQTDGVK
jgi:hypothetical protein